MKIRKWRGGDFIVRNDGHTWEFVLFFRGTWHSHQFKFTKRAGEPYTQPEYLDCIQAVIYAAEITIKRLREERSLMVRLGLRKMPDQSTFRESDAPGGGHGQDQSSFRQGESKEGGYVQPGNTFREEGNPQPGTYSE